MTPDNLDALMRLLNEPNSKAADPLIDQISAMDPADRERVITRGEGEPEPVRRNIEAALIRARYRAVEPEWAALEGRELEQGLALISRTAENPPALDMAAVLNGYAEDVGKLLSGDRAFDEGLAALTEVLYRRHHLRGNAGDYYAPENSYLAHVLDSGFGIPISLCSIAILVGRRLELPVNGVGAPGHFLGFYGDADLRIGNFFDPFDGFRRLTSGEVRVLVGRYVETFDQAQLKPVKDNAILARVLRNLSGVYTKRGHLEHVRNLERWIRLIPV